MPTIKLPSKLCKRCLSEPCVRGSKFCQRCKDEKLAERKKYENMLSDQLALAGMLDGSDEDYHFDDVRGWTFDRAWRARMIAYEVDGGNRMARINKRTGQPFAVGRHVQSDDYRKLNAAVERGWRVMRFTPEMIRSGEAFATMQDVLIPLPFSR